MVELERGELDRAQACCVALGQVAARMGDQDVPFARAITVLTELVAGKTGARERLCERSRRAARDRRQVASGLRTQRGR